MDDILTVKADKAKELKERGVELFPHRWERTHAAVDAAALGAGLEPMQDSAHRVRVAGRLVQIRDMGKAAFAHILDGGFKLQLYLKKDLLGDVPYDLFKKDLHLGDFVGVSGVVFKTKTGEISVKADTLTLLAKALRPMPEKWHGLQDTDTRYRQRHMDLIANEESRKTFRARSEIVAAVRKSFHSLGFLEVETPILLHQAGGASATPFQTHHIALDSKLYLRIATELYLKRLIIGGFEKVYEIGRVFRNEGIDTRHNPEFTMLEAYQAYTDYNGMADLFEKVLREAAAALGKTSVEYRGQTVDFAKPFARLRLPELWKTHCGADIHEVLEGKSFNVPALKTLARALHVKHDDNPPAAKLFDRILDEKVLSHVKEGAFLFDHPTAITPLAKCKQNPDGTIDPALVERFEFFVAGDEFANAYTELNDPMDQRERFAEQAKQKAAGDAEVEVLDEDFVQAMEAGMPPTGGIGIGVDRLIMLLTGNASIREVVLFPTLKPE